MSEILRDPMWQFIIGTIIAFVTIIVGIVVYFKQRQHKELSYKVVSNTPLLSVDKVIKKDLQILYQGKSIQEVNLVTLDIVNSGNMPILATDYERSVCVNFGEEAQVLTAEIINSKPKNLGASINVEKGTLILNPVLLNDGDIVSLKAIVSKLSKIITVDGRIVGVKMIKELSEDSTGAVVFAVSGLIVLLIGGILFVLNLATTWPSTAFSTALILGGYILMGSSLLFDKKTRRRFFRLLKNTPSISIEVNRD